MEEIFKDIEGYEGLYQVSNLGRVKSLGNGVKSRNEKILKPVKCAKGYLIVNLCKEGKCKNHLIHRLVAKAFIENPDNLPQINHIDEDKTNNRVDNLEWCSPKYNANFGSRNKRLSKSLTNYPKFSKRVLCIETGKIYFSAMQVERELGFAHSNISAVCLGKYKSAYGFHWRFI